MISWIQKYFQHHFKIIFAVLLGVTIIAFVFTIGASPGIGTAERSGVIDRPFFGYNLSLQSDQQRLMSDAGLSASLRLGSFAQLDGDQLQNYAFQRAATLHLADQWHFPAPTPAEVTDQIKKLRMFAGQDGQFDAKAYQTFRDNLKTNPRGLTEADIVRVIGDDVRAEKVQALLAGPGYVLPIDIKTQLARAETTWTLATATADYTGFQPEIKPTETELTQFFEQAGGRYDIPPRVVVNYLEFTALSFLDKISLTEAEVRSFYDANPSRFPKPADPAKPDATTPNVTPPANPAADFAAVRPQVESTLKFERAQKAAARAASDVSYALFESKAKTPEALAKFLEERKLTLKTLAPFPREAAPAELAGSGEAVAEAFRLNKDRPVSDAVTTSTGAVILFWKETQPSRKPLFTEEKDRVSADYLEGERRKRFIELGKAVKADLETGIKAGDTLEKAGPAVAANRNLKIEVKSIAPFTPRTRPPDLDFSVLGALERLEKGQISDMIMSGDKGIFIHTLDKQPPDQSESNPKFAEMRTQIAGMSGRIGASAYLAEIVDRELKKTLPKTE